MASFFRKAGYSRIATIPKSMNYYGNYINEGLFLKDKK
jgi:hypothetical protein